MTGAGLPPVLNFVGLGHSHVVALAKGAYALEAKGAEVGGRAICGRFRYLYDADFTPPFADAARSRLNPAIEAALDDGAADFVLLSIGGNEHNVVSIRQPARRFDFILGEAPDAPLDPKAEIVPEAAIRETLRDYMNENMRVLQAIRATCNLPMALVEPPPPLPRAQVLAYPKEFFRSQIDQRSMSSDLLRRKVWRVQVGMMRQACAALGVAYVETPSDMFGADGLLKASVCGQDATHANDGYGETMIELAARLMAAPAQGSG